MHLFTDKVVSKQELLEHNIVPTSSSFAGYDIRQTNSIRFLLATLSQQDNVRIHLIYDVAIPTNVQLVEVLQLDQQQHL